MEHEVPFLMAKSTFLIPDGIRIEGDIHVQ
jgi:hypothetical protein